MSKRQLLILLGIWNMVFLFLGFPSAADKIFALASGAIIVTIAFAFKPKEKASPKGTVPYVEHKSSQAEQASAPITSADTTTTSS